MNLFECLDYKEYVRVQLKNRPKKGHGQFLKLAEFLSVHTSFISQVFKGDKDISFEQASRVAEYLGLNQLETDYFVTLVQYQRSGNTQLKQLNERRLKELSNRSKNLTERFGEFHELDERDKAMFYSSWCYMGVQLITSIKEYNTPEAIAEYFDLPIKLVRDILYFLAETGLCVEEDGVYKIGPSHTHIEASHPLVSRHHLNWRHKAQERIPKIKEGEMVYTCPMTLPENKISVVRELLVQAMQKIDKEIEEGEEEVMACLNIDWVRILA